MPPVTLKSSSDLEIVLEATTYTPGATIVGYVLRKSPAVDPNTSLSICLYGRTQVWIATGGMGTQQYRSRFSLFDSSRQVLHIHQGPIHIPPNSSDNEHGRWPFVITLPTHPELTTVTRDNEKERTFVPFDQMASQELPPSIAVKEKIAGRYTEGFVEYFLEATMRCSRNQKDTLVSRKKNQEFQAILPLHIQPDVSSIPLSDFSPAHRSEPKQRLVSQRLVTGGDARLGVGQHLQKMFKSSQVPSYSFALELDFATLLQIGNPNPIPLCLRATTIWPETTDALHQSPPTILVKQFSLNLKSTAVCTCKWFDKRRARTEGISVVSSVSLADYTSPLGTQSASLPQTSPAKTRSNMPLIVPQDDPTALDLGAALGIRSPKRSGWSNLYPTFTTCNIRATHAIEWKITLSIAGETVKYQGEQPVTLMSPSYPPS